MNKTFPFFCVMAAFIVLLNGCASDDTAVHSIKFPPTEKVEAVFQKNRIPESCRVFAHLFANMPAGYTGQQFVDAVSGEAKSKGADMMLIGHSRQCTTETDLSFKYYGPGREYKIRDWPAWSYGFEDWQEQGAWASIGYKEWGNGEVHYDYPILMQVVFVRCQ